MYDTLLHNIEETHSDISACGFYSFDELSRNTLSNNTNKIFVLHALKDIYYHVLEPEPLLRFEVWNKLFRRETIGSVRFKEGQVYEDIYFDRNVFANAKK